MKSFNFNRIYIIQSIDPEDPKQSLLREPGPELEKDINEKLEELKVDATYKDVACELIKVDSTEEWESTWKRITQECQDGIKPIIHLICHGNKECMAISNKGEYKLFTWQEVYDILEKANKACHNNLFVTMSVCYGFWSLKKLFTNGNRIPFCGILASPETVNVYDAKVRFTDFYLSLLTNKNVNDAINNVIADIDKIWKKIGHRPNDLVLKFSDELFVENFTAVYNRRLDEEELKREAVKALNDAGLPVIKTCIDSYIKVYQEHIPEIYKDIVNHKFMFDIYPEERSRFDIPEDLEKLIRG